MELKLGQKARQSSKLKGLGKQLKSMKERKQGNWIAFRGSRCSFSILMGRIHLEGIEVMARIGLLEEEQHAPQDLYVTVDLTYDFSKVRKTDELEDGIDYREIIDCVKNFASDYHGNMLERFAHLMARKLKDSFPLEKLKLSVEKPRYTKKLGLREISVSVEC